MTRTGDPIHDFHVHDSELEEALTLLPKCCECEEPIQEEKFYDFDGEYVCEHCVLDYINKRYRVSTNHYIL